MVRKGSWTPICRKLVTKIPSSRRISSTRTSWRIHTFHLQMCVTRSKNLSASNSRQALESARISKGSSHHLLERLRRPLDSVLLVRAGCHPSIVLQKWRPPSWRVVIWTEDLPRTVTCPSPQVAETSKTMLIIASAHLPRQLMAGRPLHISSDWKRRLKQRP